MMLLAANGIYATHIYTSLLLLEQWVERTSARSASPGSSDEEGCGVIPALDGADSDQCLAENREPFDQSTVTTYITDPQPFQVYYRDLRKVEGHKRNTN